MSKTKMHNMFNDEKMLTNLKNKYMMKHLLQPENEQKPSINLAHFQ